MAVQERVDEVVAGAAARPVGAAGGVVSATGGEAGHPQRAIDGRAVDATGDRVADGRAGALVQAVAGDQAGAAWSAPGSSVGWIWRLAAGDVPDAHLVERRR